MEKELIVGIDIGTTKIAVLIGTKDENDDIIILGMGKAESIGVERGMVRNIEQTSKSIEKAVAEAERKANCKVKEVFVGIAGHDIHNRQHRGNIMLAEKRDIITEDDKDRLIKEQKNIALQPGEKIIHVIPQSFTVDGEENIVNPVGMPGNSLEGVFNIITANVNNIENIVRSVEMAGYKVKNLILEPIASAEAVVDENEKEAGICLVDIGGGTTDIAIFSEGILRHTAVIPLAGNVITDDIKEGCSIIKTQAEALKVNFGSCLAAAANENEIIAIPGFRGREAREISRKTLAEIIEARMTMIIDQVLFEIKSHKYEKKLIAGIVLSGGGAEMNSIVQLTEFLTGINARVGKPNEQLKDTSDTELSHPMYATSIGLILEGKKELAKEKKEEKSPMAIFDGEEGMATPIVEEANKNQEEADNSANKEGKNRIMKWLENIFKDEDEGLK
ncbi:MAG: cell division protein FtsA [Bacteroidales bacterium]|jgi:cell division protein FtsA|nr:cell division protein FtsA [Bacteroidales bacterium]